jgi:hypothetical protein
MRQMVQHQATFAPRTPEPSSAASCRHVQPVPG